MTRSELATAAEHLADAADAPGDAEDAERLGELAAQLDRLAEADEGPDHGRLARVQAALVDLREGAGQAAVEAIDAADDAIDDYRETLEGV